MLHIWLVGHSVGLELELYLVGSEFWLDLASLGWIFGWVGYLVGLGWLGALVDIWLGWAWLENCLGLWI